MHYTVLVLTEDGNIDAALAPFSEHLEVEPYISKTRDEAAADGQQRLSRIAESMRKAAENGEITSFPEPLPGFPFTSWVQRVPTDTDLAAAKLLEDAPAELGYAWETSDADDDELDDDGNLVSTYNPDSTWDWYVIGGRWSGALTLKNGEHVDSACIGDIEFTPDPEVAARLRRLWEVNVDGAPLRDGEDRESMRMWESAEWLKKTFHDADSFAEARSGFSTWAVLDLDGNWHEQGYDDDAEITWPRDYMKNHIEGLSPDVIATVVDYHI